MIGNALIWTTGKEGTLSEGLYAFENTGHSLSSVERDEASDWMEVNVTINRRRLMDGEIRVVYQQSLDNTQDFSTDTDTIGFSYAIGDSGSTVLHSIHVEVGSYFEVNLETGAIVVTEEDLSLETAHGIIMFIAWSVLCVIGIFASSFRDLWPWPQHKKTYWFSVHKAVQISVVVLTLIGFAISVHMTEDAGMPHFDSLHQQLGLTMAIIAVIQPLNALIRPKPTVSSQPKPAPRWIWEVIHKVLGYGGWILSQWTIHEGIQLICKKVECSIDVNSSWYWMSFMLFIFIALMALTQSHSLQSTLFQKKQSVSTQSPSGRTSTGLGTADDEIAGDGDTEMTSRKAIDRVDSRAVLIQNEADQLPLENEVIHQKNKEEIEVEDVEDAPRTESKD